MQQGSQFVVTTWEPAEQGSYVYEVRSDYDGIKLRKIEKDKSGEILDIKEISLNTAFRQLFPEDYQGK